MICVVYHQVLSEKLVQMISLRRSASKMLPEAPLSGSQQMPTLQAHDELEGAQGPGALTSSRFLAGRQGPQELATAPQGLQACQAAPSLDVPSGQDQGIRGVMAKMAALVRRQSVGLARSTPGIAQASEDTLMELGGARRATSQGEGAEGMVWGLGNAEGMDRWTCVCM